MMLKSLISTCLVILTFGYIGCGSSSDSGGSGSIPIYFNIYDASGNRISDGYGDYVNWQSIVECIDTPFIQDQSYDMGRSACNTTMSMLVKDCGTAAAAAEHDYYLTEDGDKGAKITCTRSGPAIGQYPAPWRELSFPAGIFQIQEQVWVPPYTKIEGVKPIVGDTANPAELIQALDEEQYTIFVTEKGYSFTGWSGSVSPGSPTQDYQTPIRLGDPLSESFPYCTGRIAEPINAKYARIGFLMHSNTEARNFVFQGGDTLRPDENDSLCGGAAFETPGCIFQRGANHGNPAECVDQGGSAVALPSTRADGDSSKPAPPQGSASWITGGYDQIGSFKTVNGVPIALENITIENIRLNDPRITSAESAKPQVNVINAANATKKEWLASQVAVYIAPTPDGSFVDGVNVSDIGSITTVADGLNLRYVYEAAVTNMIVANPGDDGFALWGDTNLLTGASTGLADNAPSATFRDIEVYYPGVRARVKSTSGGMPSGPGGVPMTYNYYSWGNCFAGFGLGALEINGLTCNDRTCPTASNYTDDDPLCFEQSNGQAVVFYSGGFFPGSYTSNADNIQLQNIDWLTESGGAWNASVNPGAGAWSPEFSRGRQYCFAVEGTAKFIGDGNQCQGNP